VLGIGHQSMSKNMCFVFMIFILLIVSNPAFVIVGIFVGVHLAWKKEQEEEYWGIVVKSETAKMGFCSIVETGAIQLITKRSRIVVNDF